MTEKLWGGETITLAAINIWDFCSKYNDNRGFFFFESLLKLLLCQQRSFYSSESIDCCPEGMFSLPQSKGGKKNWASIKKMQAKQIWYTGGRMSERWTVDCNTFFACFHGWKVKCYIQIPIFKRLIYFIILLIITPTKQRICYKLVPWGRLM